MEVQSKRTIKSGAWYKHLVPHAKGGTVLIKPGASVKDTLRFIPKMVRATLEDTLLLAPRLKGKNLRATCRNIWQFVVDHIRYEKDAKGKEQVRRPARTLHEQVGDCDCMTALVSSILLNLGLRHSLSVTKYMGRKYFQHIYVSVPKPGGGNFIIDPVVDEFDYEEPFTEKIDIKMDLQYLNGPVLADGELFEDNEIDFEDAASDMDHLPFDEDDLDGLGRRRRRRRKKKKKKKRGGFIKRGLHAINKFNPATVLLRAGILAAAKMDIPRKKKRGGQRTSLWRKLKLSYLTEQQARQRGFNMRNWAQMKKVRARLEKIFHGAGGKPENLKKAILKGKANADREVPLSGLYGFGNTDDLNFHDGSSLLEILGPEIYNSEIVKPQMALSGHNGGLGEVATGAAITAAMTVLTAIAAMVGKVGQIRGAINKARGKGGGAGVDPMDPQDASFFDPNQQLPTRSADDLPDFDSGGGGDTPLPDFSDGDGRSEANQRNQRGSGSDSDDDKDEDKDKPKKSFGEWFGSGGWMWFAGGAAALGLGFIAYRALRKPQTPAKAKSSGGSKAKAQPALAGPGRKKKRRSKRRKPSATRRRPSLAGRRSPRLGSRRPGAGRTKLSGTSRRPSLAGILDGPKKSRRKSKPKGSSKRKRTTKKSGKRKQVNLN